VFGDVDALRSGFREALFDSSVREAALRAAPAFRETLTWTWIAVEQLAFYQRIIGGLPGLIVRRVVRP
jgi:hypothetical protein